MNKRLILYLTLVVVILQGAFFSSVLFLPARMPDTPEPPAILAMECAWKTLTFPTAFVFNWVGKEAPRAVVFGSVPIAIVVNALVWAVIL